MTHIMLSILGVAAVLTIAAGGAVPADAGKLKGSKKGTSAAPDKAGYDLTLAKPTASQAASARARRTTGVGGVRLRRGTPTQASDSKKEKWIDVQSSSW
jgi:hypothetical protein